jgi:hypothetical protein
MNAVEIYEYAMWYTRKLVEMSILLLIIICSYNLYECRENI